MDDDDLWGPPLVVQDDTFRKQTLRSCEFWFDFRTDVLEENFQNERDCVQVWRLLNEKKKLDAEIYELDKDSVSVSPRNDMASCGSGELHDSTDSDKALSVIPPDAETSSAKSALHEDDNTSSISDAKTIETRDFRNDTEEVDTETKLKPKETALYDPPTVEVAEDAETTSSPVLASKVEEAEEHSCSSLVTTQVFDPIKQALENKSSSAISSENIGGTSLLDTGEKVREKANATNDDGEALKDHEQSNSLQDIVTASEPFTTESLLELCDEPDKGREIACDVRSKKSHLEAVKAVVKDELIINLFTEARRKAESNTLLNPGSILTKKRQRDSKGMNTSFIRNTKQNVRDEVGEINTDASKNSAHSKPEISRGSSVPIRHADSLLDSKDGSSQRDGHIVSDSVISLSTSELKKKTGKELRSIAKALKVTHYYKLKKEDLVQQLTSQLNPS